MLFNEQEMLEVCKKYGIDVVEKDGYPLFKNEEMDDDFSMYNIMHDSCGIDIQEKTLYSKTMNLKIPIEFEGNDFINCSTNSIDNPCFIGVNKDNDSDKERSTISNGSIFSMAA